MADYLRRKFPMLGALMVEAEHEVLACMTFPRAHWMQIYSSNSLERLNAEIKRRTDVVGIFPNDASIVGLVAAMMLERNDEWSLNRRHMQLEGLKALSDTPPTRPVPAGVDRRSPSIRYADSSRAPGQIHAGCVPAACGRDRVSRA